jgi:hypothetical protein
MMVSCIIMPLHFLNPCMSYGDIVVQAFVGIVGVLTCFVHPMWQPLVGLKFDR